MKIEILNLIPIALFWSFMENRSELDVFVFNRTILYTKSLAPPEHVV